MERHSKRNEKESLPQEKAGRLEGNKESKAPATTTSINSIKVCGSSSAAAAAAEIIGKGCGTKI